MKLCSRCKIVKDESEFYVYVYVYKGVSVKRPRSRCRACLIIANNDWAKTFKEKNPEMATMRSHARSRRIGNRFSYFKADAKRRNLDFDVTLPQFRVIVSNPCYYCNGLLNEAGCGIDRTDSFKGYVIGNVVPCCKRCNIAKGNMSEVEFKGAITRVYEHWARL